MNLKMKSSTAGSFAGAFGLATLLASALFLPGLARAQTTPPTVTMNAASFTPSSSDLTNYILKAIFGDWGSGASVPMIGPAMQVLCLFALAFGTLMFTYVAVVGTLMSAQDGELLGKKWSSMWVPARFVLGTAMLVPLPTGYCTAQHLVLWLALSGGGAATAVWNAALGQFTTPTIATASVIQSEDFKQKVNSLARKVLQAEVCNAIHRLEEGTSVRFSMNAPAGTSYTNADTGISTTAGNALTSPTVTTNAQTNSTTVGGDVLQWGVTGSAGAALNTDYTANYCGSLVTSTLMVDTSAPAAPISTSNQQATSGALSSQPTLTAGNSLAAYQAMALAQGQGISQMHTTLAAFASTYFVPTATPPASAQITAIVSTAAAQYINATTAATTGITSAAASQLSNFTTSSQSAGWMMAGATFFQMARIKSAANAAMTTIPSFNSEKSTADAVVPSVTQGPLFEDANGAAQRINIAFAGTSSNAEWANIGKDLSQYMAEAVSFSPTNPDHALVQIKDKGDYLLGGLEAAGITALGLLDVATTANEALGSAPLAGGLLSSVGKGFLEAFHTLLPAIYIAAIALFGVALSMSFFIPMMPFVLSIGAILGWLMAVFSAIVATPIWLAGHLHPEGDGFAGKALGGYMILLETITRPMFIVFGFIGAFSIMDPVLKFVSWGFRANLSSVQGNSVTGPVSIVVFAMIFVSIVWTVVKQSLQLVYVLSENVYRWIGGAHAGMEQSREFAQAMGGAEGAMGNQVQQVYGAASGQVARRSDARNASRQAAAKAEEKARTTSGPPAE
jgi:conjugal transfer/type IV secretion protein DotA/TraY